MEEHLATSSTHFFKVLIAGFNKKLKLPPAFCEKLKEEKSEWAKLRSCKGRWKIKVCRDCEGLISFEGGWPQFVDEHSLSYGDFLVFQHLGGLNFTVFVFDQTASEKQFLIQPKTEIMQHEALAPPPTKKANKRKAEEKSAVVSFNSRNPHFVTIMQPSHATKRGLLTIPIGFVRLNNLGNKTSATLRNGRGRAWPMSLCSRKVGQFRVYLWGGGWRDFYDSNELKTGDVCVFYLNPGLSRTGTISFDVKICPPTV